MMSITELHNCAMALADEADILKRLGRKQDAKEKYAESYRQEKDAAILAMKNNVEEPAISILLKSAACLAYDAELLRECEQLIGLALSRDLPNEIAEELRDLLENVNFSRHLRLNGVSLDENEIQLVVAGDGVAHGMARKIDVDSRLDTLHKLTLRTLERKTGNEFRTRGRIPEKITNQCQTYFSIPRAASFAISVRIGQKDEDLQIEGVESRTSALIDDVVTNLKLVNQGDYETLKQRIKDEKYLLNFVSHAKEFAPDGKDVSLVGITYMKNGEEVQVPLQRVQNEYVAFEEQLARESIKKSLIKKITIPETEIENTLEGTFSAADASEQNFKITIGNRKFEINVPDGLSDIVRKYFDEVVSARVLYNPSKDKYSLISINALQTKLSLEK